MPLQFDAEAIGTVALCPHCRQQTELMLAAPPQERLIPRRAIVLGIVTAVILALGAIGITMALQRARRLADDRPPSAGMGKTNRSPNQPAHPR
jgi:hypothetical protein